jgi:hypothetical protein
MKIDLALGSYEAAAILGVHFTRPRLMAGAGKLITRQLGAGIASPAHIIQIYSLADCEQDYRDYEDRVREHGGRHYRRPRAWLHLRPAALKRLAKAVPVEFSDACSVSDAAQILNLSSTSLITRLIRNGQIVGRKAWNPRYTAGEQWIISRRSVEERKRDIIARETAGVKTGVRKFVAKKAKA